ncbi:MAG: hypothetical protein PVI21_01005 [Candidatus Woesebacteria bacterium]|jgi:hypothetical protein
MIEPAIGVLFIVPQRVDREPVIDDLARKMSGLLLRAKADVDLSGIYYADMQQFSPRISTRGVHSCCCGACSTNQDYVIGRLEGCIVVVTNWLAVHYLVHHRSSVTQSDLDLIAGLDGKLVEPTPDLLISPASR